MKDALNKEVRTTSPILKLSERNKIHPTFMHKRKDVNSCSCKDSWKQNEDLEHGRCLPKGKRQEKNRLLVGIVVQEQDVMEQKENV